MKYYFEVKLDCNPTINILVLAKDIIEAGQKVLDMYPNPGIGGNRIGLAQITRTDIAFVINE